MARAKIGYFKKILVGEIVLRMCSGTTIFLSCEYVRAQHNLSPSSKTKINIPFTGSCEMVHGNVSLFWTQSASRCGHLIVIVIAAAKSADM